MTDASSSKSWVPPNALWQAGRWMPALDADSYRLDDRGIEDLAQWALGFAGLLVYFDANNRAVQPEPGQPPVWSEFFAADITFLLAEISCTDPPSDYQECVRDRVATETAINRDLQQLASWARRAETLAFLAPDDSVEAEFNGIIQRASENELRNALPRYRKSAAGPAADFLPEAWFDDGTGPDEADVVYSLLNRVTGQIVARGQVALRASLKEKSDHPPQTALFLTFLQLLRKNQVDLNGLTERHLAFYYDKVLRLMPRSAQPDRARLAFSLAPESPGIALPQGTALIAGSASVPDPTVFLTDHPLRINRIGLVRIGAVSVNRRVTGPGQDDFEVQAIRCFPEAASADGFGAPLSPGVTAWPPFGPDETHDPRSQARLGVGFEAQVLAMNEGTRRITLTLTFNRKKHWTLHQALNGFAARVARLTNRAVSIDDPLLPVYVMGALRLEVHSGSDTIALKTTGADLSQAHRDRLVLHGTIPASVPAIVAADGYEAPLLSMTLDPDAPIYGYDLLAGARLKGVRIDVSVQGLRGLDLFGPFGPIDPKKPFAPFGLAPKPGDALYIATPELTRDTLQSLQLTVNWTGLPVAPDTFASHYKAYNTSVTDESFKLRISRSDGAAWYPLWPKGEIPGTGKPPPKEAAVMTMFTRSAPSSEAVSDQSVYAVADGPQSDQTRVGTAGAAQRPGAVKVEFTAPPEGFGQTLYPSLVAKVAIINAQPWWARLKLPKGLKSGLLLVPPEPPLLPMVAEISADYTASEDTAQVTAPDSAIRLYQFNPLGAPTRSRDGRVISGAFDFDGMLLFGLSNVDPPDTVTLLFDIGDLVARPWVAGNGFARPALQWMYFDGKRWQDLEGDAVEIDETGGLVTHGIVRLALPVDIAPGPQYPGGLCWLGVMVDGDTSRYGDFTRILPQAVSATRQIKPGAEPDGQPVLAAGSITRLAQPKSAIKAVVQPFASEDGRAAETTRQFRTRVSERLSHKQRAILPRDYERLVLEAFPEIGQVGCLTRGPGHVELIVSPRRYGTVSKAALPKVPLHRRLAISDWIKLTNGDDAIHVMVRNPDYETVQVRAKIVPSRGASSALIHSVEDEIDRIIAPWLMDPDVPMPVGNSRLDPATLRARIEKMPGVDRLWALSVQQVYRLNGAQSDALYGFKDTARQPGQTGHAQQTHGSKGDDAHHSKSLSAQEQSMSRSLLRGAAPWSVLVPARNHRISFMPPRKGIGDLTIGQDLLVTPQNKHAAYLADPGLIPARAIPVGIGDLTIGSNFILTDPEDAIAPQNTAIGTSSASTETLLMPLSELD